MKCLNPITLKNGLTVPCGKCPCCLEARRDDWSVRLQLHCYGYTNMPLFVTLTYDDKHLPFDETGLVSLKRSDVSLFIKRLKDKYDLYNTDFSNFGCGEYGDTFGRPHYHVLMFGLDDFYRKWLRDSHSVENEFADVWQNGLVDVKQAEWSGIHYVTKYTLKQLTDEYDNEVSPFIFNSHGIGKPWLYTSEAVHVRATFDVRSYQQRLNSMLLDLDFSSTEDIYYTSNAICRYLEPYVPKLYCTVPSGKRCKLPRYLRDSLYSSGQHFMDHPFWFYDSMCKLRDATRYYLDFGNNDADKTMTVAQENARNYALRLINMMKRKTKNRKRI